ncbi:MAG: chromosomal replication initiator protein DnaA [Spirochaetaceae bacterium]|jgi:chromosomal replication initiator protein|nr:chromosomal replication initiator protein DnaA [Spirochaetaceae bacterium]
MSPNEHNLWLQSLDSLKSEVESQDIAFLDGLEFSGLEETAVHITVSNAFIKEIVKSRFSERLTALLIENFNKPLTLIIDIKDEPPQNSNAENSKIIKENTEKTIPIEKNPVLEVNTPVSSKIQTAPEKAYYTRSGKQYPLNLNDEYTFDAFIPDQTTKYAYAVAQAVSRNPGNDIGKNPLFIYGGVGVGKTHLMQAIGNYAFSNSDNKIVFTTAENFLNDFIESVGLKGSSGQSFRNKYRKADILLIDDIHLLSVKALGTQEELFNTINALTGSKKQLVFTCDRPAIELKHFEQRLSSRLGQGVQVSLQMPSFETRFAILEKRTEKTSVVVPKEIINLICKNISSNVRDLLAAFNKIVSYAELLNEQITLDVAREQLKEYISSTKQNNLSIELIQKCVADYFSVSVKELIGKGRKTNITNARHYAMFMARTLTQLSYEEIGEHFGGKDHSTVMHGYNNIEKSKKLNPQLESTIQELTGIIKENAIK